MAITEGAYPLPEERAATLFPGSITLYVCDGCNRTNTYHPLNHRSKSTGKKCDGQVWVRTYTPATAPERT